MAELMLNLRTLEPAMAQEWRRRSAGFQTSTSGLKASSIRARTPS
jgi:hypothetical protein